MTDREKLIELRHCPCCGGKSEAKCVSFGTEQNRAFKEYTIRCTECGLKQPRSVAVYYGYDTCNGSWADEKELVEAIEKWNTRAIE